MPGLVLALVALFPTSNTGLELAAVLMIFTSQVWNMTFSFYRSIQTVPREQQEAAQVFGFTWLQKFGRVEVPFATLGLVWNSMMSMAGGWFFLTVSESFTLGDQDFRLPGLGSYMQAATAQENTAAQIYAIIAMMVMVVSLDQLLWRPMVAWAQKFRVEEGGGGEVASSWFLEWLQRSHLLSRAQSVAFWVGRPCARFARTVGRQLKGLRRSMVRPAFPLADDAAASNSRSHPVASAFSLCMLIALVVLMAWGAVELMRLLRQVHLQTWEEIAASGGITFARVFTAVVLGTLWTLPAGLIIGLSPRLSRILQPIIQIAASFPASMLFVIVVGALYSCGLPLGFSSIVLMMLGTQWYILFNVIAGAMTIPADLREAARAYGIVGFQRFRILYFPAIFPYLVTGWVTAMGGAWNASIVAELMTTKAGELSTVGLGAMISKAATSSDMPTLAASVVGMSFIVVGINRTVWRRLYRISETTYCIDK
jgi:NitT/TauT family transport system permease protein